jgi:hypothetical protein
MWLISSLDLLNNSWVLSGNDTYILAARFGKPITVKRVLDEAPHIETETQPVQTTPTTEAERAEREKTVKSTASTVYDHLSRYEGRGVGGKSDT